MAFIAILFFYPDDLEGRVLQQSDIQQGLANGQEGKAFQEATGETTRWTNSLLGGMPNFQIAPSYSSAPLLNWFAKAYSLWLPSPANLLFIMMLGFFIMGLCMKMRWYVALLGAIAWGFSTYFIIIIGAGHIWKFVTLAYIPPTIGGIVLCYRGRYLAGGALAALFGSLQLLSNHPQMSYYFLMVIAAMMIAFLIQSLREKEFRKWAISTGVVVAAGVLAVGANCASLYNTAQYSKETIRGKATDLTIDNAPAASGADFDYITAWSYGADETFTLLVPDVKGGASLIPQKGQNYPKLVADLPAVQKMIDKGEIYPEHADIMRQIQLTQYFGGQPMTNGPVYVGAFILMLAVLAMAVCRGPMKWALIVVSILAILLSWGYNFEWLSRLFIDYFPGYNKFRTVSSILVIVEFTIPLLAMMVLQMIITRDDFYDRYKNRFFAVAGIFATICLLLWLFPTIFGDGLSIPERQWFEEQGLFAMPEYTPFINAVREARLSMVSADAGRSLLIIIVGSAIIWLYISGKMRNNYFLIGSLVTLTLLDLFFVNKRYINSESFTAPMSETSTFRMTEADSEILADTAMNYRVMDVDDMGGARSSYFHKTIGGYHAAKLTRYNDLLNYINSAEAQQEVNKWLNYRLIAAAMPDSVEGIPAPQLPGVINMLNTKYLLFSAQDANGNEVRVAEHNDGAYGNAWFVKTIGYVDSSNDEMAVLHKINPATDAVADKKFESVLGKVIVPDSASVITETSYAPNRLTYHTDSKTGGIAVFSEVYFPWGWTATIDGKEAPIGRVDYILRALRIPAGEHTVIFTFNPKSLEVTNTLSVISVIIIYLVCAAALALAVRRYLRKK